MIPCYNQATGRDCSSMEEDLRLCARYGFRCLEPRMDMAERYLKGHSMEELVGGFRAHGIRAQAVNAVYLYRELLTDEDDPGRAEDFWRQFLFACRLAQALLSPCVILVPPMNSEEDRRPFDLPWEVVEEKLPPVLRLLADLAAGHSTAVALEPVGAARSSVRTVGQAKTLLEKAGRSNTGLAVDAFNLYLRTPEAPFAELSTLRAEDVLVVHINDGDDCPWEKLRQSNRTFCGTGRLDLADFLGRLREIGYHGPVSIETFRPEYWALPPEEVVSRAWSTTVRVMTENGVLEGEPAI